MLRPTNPVGQMLAATFDDALLDMKGVAVALGPVAAIAAFQ
jgi:hypothetical protein